MNDLKDRLAAMESKVDKVDQKIDFISNTLTDIKVVLAQNTTTLVVHEKRSQTNEDALALEKKDRADGDKTLQEAVTPLVEDRLKFKGMMMLFGGLLGLATFLDIVLKLIHN